MGLLFSSTHFLKVIVQSYAVAVFIFCIVPVVIGVVHVEIEVGGDNIQLEADFVFFFYGRKFYACIAVKRSEYICPSLDQSV